MVKIWSCKPHYPVSYLISIILVEKVISRHENNASQHSNYQYFHLVVAATLFRGNNIDLLLESLSFKIF